MAETPYQLELVALILFRAKLKIPANRPLGSVSKNIVGKNNWASYVTDCKHMQRSIVEWSVQGHEVFMTKKACFCLLITVIFNILGISVHLILTKWVDRLNSSIRNTRGPPCLSWFWDNREVTRFECSKLH